MDREPMNCETCRDLLGAFLEGTLPDPDRDRLRDHLESCADCRIHVQQLREIDALLALVPAEEKVPAALTDKILTTGPSPLRRVRKPLLWATAATVLITAALAWILTRPAPISPDNPEGPEPHTVSARLHLNHMVGRILAGATYRLYPPRVGTVFHDLTLLGIDPALSWNNVRIALDSPWEEAVADAQGRIRLKRPLGTGIHLVYVQKAGHLGAWGFLEPVEAHTEPDMEVVLYPARTLKIEGLVVEDATGKPLAGALVATPDGTGTAITGKDGKFSADFEVLPGRLPAIWVIAEGHAEAGKRVDRKALKAGTCTLEVRLKAARRLNTPLCLTDPEGAPVEGALVLAYPDLEDGNGDGDRPRLPPLRRKRPEVGVTDDTGSLVLRQLLPCRYRLEVSHPRFSRAEPRYVPAGAAEAVPITVKPAGDAWIRLTVARPGGSPLPTARVVLARTHVKDNTAIPHRILQGATDLEGNVLFRRLAAGRAVVQIHTPEGHGYYLSFPVDRGDRVPIPYTLPTPLHTLQGTLAPALRGKIRMVRLEGDLPRTQAGRNRTTAHTFAVETPVLEDGTFTFPALPRLRKASLGGRLTMNAGARPVELASVPPVADVLAGKTAGPKRVDVTKVK